MDTEKFIEKAKQIHGNKYDYSKVEYINSETKVCIICPEHGEFFMKVGNHINGKQGCPKCGLLKRAKVRSKTTEQFIQEAKNIHGDKYDYSKSIYINIDTKICIICHEKDEFGNEHGEFWQTPYHHLKSSGCPKCNKGVKQNFDDFIKRAKLIHNNKYDYSKAEYINSMKKICIICPQHGEFWQTPNNHTNNKQGCPKCCGKNKTTEEFINELNNIHEGKYDYSKLNYTGIFNKIEIICPQHGIFYQTAHDHLSGHGCLLCKKEKMRNKFSSNTEEFIKKAKEIHGDKYDYSKVEYINNHTKVCIICPKHGEFWQTPNKHLIRKGCPICHESEMEEIIRNLLLKNKIIFQQEKRFNDFKRRRFDFYLPNHNLIIECQGKQHFEDVNIFKTKFKEQLIIDKEKYNWCKNNNIEIIYFTYENYKKLIPFDEILYKNNIYFKTIDILNYINNHGKNK